MVDQVTEQTLVQSLPTMLAPGVVLLGKYRIDAKLGVGGYGLVLRAHDLALDEDVAIKILRADVELDRENLERFFREAQAVVQLKSEHVVKVYDVGKLEDGAPYMVMELLDGMDLGKLVETSSRLGRQLAVDYVVQACDALAEAHALGIVHRDIKPSNLFLTKRPDGSQLVKVLDFGISKTITKPNQMSLTQTQSVLGTPAYMSPEQMRSARQVDHRTDIWSLGAVLYELVEGRLPFGAENFAEQVVLASTKPHEPMEAAPELARVVDKCLGKEPKDRYENLAELAADLAPFATFATSRAPIARIHRVLGAHVPQSYESSPSMPRMGPPAPRRRRAWVAAIGGVVAVGAIVTIVAVTRGDSDSSAATPVPEPAKVVQPAVAPIPQPTPTPESAVPSPSPSPSPTPTPSPSPSPSSPQTNHLAKRPPKKPPATTTEAKTPPPPPKKCDPFSDPKGCRR